jgi:IMP and pyridine-specific 5'-nucleotidase
VCVRVAQGGECNYLLRLRPSDYRLEFVPDAEWQMPQMKLWTQEQVTSLLDGAQQLLEDGAERLRLPVQVRLSRAAVCGLNGRCRKPLRQPKCTSH